LQGGGNEFWPNVFLRELKYNDRKFWSFVCSVTFLPGNHCILRRLLLADFLEGRRSRLEVDNPDLQCLDRAEDRQPPGLVAYIVFDSYRKHRYLPNYLD
jgi:hypothetical protein